MPQMIPWLKVSLVGNKPLGPLELQVLRVLWKRGEGTVRDLLDEGLVQGAYTTVMTTLDRLHKKGLLARVRDGRAYRYRPRQTEAECDRAAVADNLRKLLTSGVEASAPVSLLVDTITEHDVALLDELERAVNRKRRELRKGTS